MVDEDLKRASQFDEPDPPRPCPSRLKGPDRVDRCLRLLPKGADTPPTFWPVRRSEEVPPAPFPEAGKGRERAA